MALSSLPSASRAAASAAVSAPPSALPPQPEPPKKANTILIKPTPDTAVVEVNGVVIGTGERSFARPGPGETHTVVVRAPDYEPATITINHDATESEWSVELSPVKDAGEPEAAATATVAEKKPPPKTGATPPKTGGTRGGKGGKGGKAPAIPDNPF